VGGDEEIVEAVVVDVASRETDAQDLRDISQKPSRGVFRGEITQPPAVIVTSVAVGVASITGHVGLTRTYGRIGVVAIGPVYAQRGGQGAIAIRVETFVRRVVTVVVGAVADLWGTRVGGWVRVIAVVRLGRPPRRDLARGGRRRRIPCAVAVNVGVGQDRDALVDPPVAVVVETIAGLLDRPAARVDSTGIARKGIQRPGIAVCGLMGSPAARHQERNP